MSIFRNEFGGLTIMNLVMIVVLAIFAGVGIDMANLIAARTQLQTAADSAAHTALLLREQMSADDAKQAAIDTALENMPNGRYGDVLRVSNIHFGTYDRSTKVFSVDDSERDAVFVKTDRLGDNANPVSSFLLQLVGFSEWDVRTTAVYETWRPNCFEEGMVGEDTVTVSSNNHFTNGFCVHSNNYAALRIDNIFDNGAIISMPHTSDIDMPASGWEQNPGLPTSLIPQAYRIRALNRLDTWYDAMVNPDHEMYRDYITSPIPVNISVTGSTHLLAPEDFTNGRVHDLTCSNGPGKATFKGPLYQNIVIRTENCDIEFSESTELRNVVIFTKSTDDKSVTAPSGLTVGHRDNCADGGDAQILTWGGVDIAGNLELNNGQIIARKDVKFAANADGFMGASIVSGATITGTSNMVMGRCNGGMDGNFEVDYFRLAG